jgi:hypothetical protein
MHFHVYFFNGFILTFFRERRPCCFYEVVTETRNTYSAFIDYAGGYFVLCAAAFAVFFIPEACSVFAVFPE